MPLFSWGVLLNKIVEAARKDARSSEKPIFLKERMMLLNIQNMCQNIETYFMI